MPERAWGSKTAAIEMDVVMGLRVLVVVLVVVATVWNQLMLVFVVL